MRIVSHHRSKQPFSVMKVLSRGEVSALQQHRAGLSQSPEKDADLRKIVGGIISDIRNRKGWLACNCRADMPDSPPILFPREVSLGVFSLVRNADRTEHADACPFRWDEGALSGRSGNTHRSGRQRVGQPDFLLYKRTEAIAADPDEDDALGSAEPSRAARSDSLQRRLFWLLEEAGVNRFSSGRLDAKAERGAILNVAKRVAVAGSGKQAVNLDEVLWGTSAWYTEGWALKRLVKLRKDGRWPARMPLQGYFLIEVDRIQDNILFAGATALPVVGAVNLFSGDSPAREPYLALVSAKLDEAAGVLQLMRAYVHPRYANPKYKEWSLFPVDSDYEREAAIALRYVAMQVDRDKRNTKPLVIEKPLHDLYPGDGQDGCRPDFILTIGERVCVVETMGSTDPDYLDRKQKTHAIMVRIGGIIEDNRPGQTADQANKNLIGRVFGWLRATGAIATSKLSQD